MTDSTEKTVLMKCTKCGYEEDVPEWVLDEMADLDGDDEYQILCPNCSRAPMYPKKSNHFK